MTGSTRTISLGYVGSAARAYRLRHPRTAPDYSKGVAFLTYTLYRILLIAGAGGILVLAGFNWRSPITWIIAVLIGALLSYVLLDRPRRAAVAQLAEHDPLRARRTREQRADAASSEEDLLLDDELERKDER